MCAIRRIMVQALFGLLFAVGSASGEPLGTGFTYQGQLKSGGAPLSTNADLTFMLFDAAGSGNPPTGGTQIGAMQTVSNVAVNGGLFTVALNAAGQFGANAFNGQARWLQIAVRSPAGSGTFTTLSPRQPITGAPYALGPWNSSAGDLSHTGGNVGIGTAQPQGLLDLNTGASDTSALFVRADPGSFGRGGIIHHQSSTYGWQELAQTTGSATDGFLAYHYVDRAAPGTKLTANVLTLRANGFVGIGTDSPGSQLDISGVQNALRITGFEPVFTLRDSNAGGARTAVQSLGGGMSFFTESYLAGTNPSAFLSLNNTGNVGIGTATPQAKLDVRGALTLDPGTSPVIYTGTGGTEQNRYLQLINSPSSPSASGLKAGGILVADSYGYANPGKNDLVVKGNVSTGGDAVQARDKGGWAKIMAYINGDGTIIRSYNALGTTSVTHLSPGQYRVNLGFQVNDRFISLTAQGQGDTSANHAGANFFFWASDGPNAVRVETFDSQTDTEHRDCPFMIIVY